MNIKRVDSIRFLYLYRYGGVYMDTDYACLRPWAEVPGLLPAGRAPQPADRTANE